MASIILDMTTPSTKASHIQDIQYGLNRFAFFICRHSLTENLQDTYRAAWAWQILLAPERIPGMITSMLQDYMEVRHIHGIVPTQAHDRVQSSGRMVANVEKYRWCDSASRLDERG
jgi:hypothetical protein